MDEQLVPALICNKRYEFYRGRLKFPNPRMNQRLKILQNFAKPLSFKEKAVIDAYDESRKGTPFNTSTGSLAKPLF